MKNKKILVIDDDINLCQSLRIGLSRAGAEVITANNGRAGIQKMYDHKPDLVLLDVRMPEMNGWETCRQIRLLSKVPIIMLTSLNKDEDIIRGLEYGADDFLSKPFNREVLLARTRAVLRRSELESTVQSDARSDASTYDDGYLSVNIENRHIAVNGSPIKLSSTEFNLFSYLFQNAGQILTYHMILVNVWGWEYQDSIEYVHVYMSHLRRKLEENPRQPIYLQNEHRVGYTFCRVEA